MTRQPVTAIVTSLFLSVLLHLSLTPPFVSQALPVL